MRGQEASPLGFQDIEIVSRSAGVAADGRRECCHVGQVFLNTGNGVAGCKAIFSGIFGTMRVLVVASGWAETQGAGRYILSQNGKLMPDDQTRPDSCTAVTVTNERKTRRAVRRPR